MKIRVDLDRAQLKLLQHALVCLKTNVPHSDITLKCLVENSVHTLEQGLEPRFRFLSENYPEHRGNLNYYFWHNRGVYEIVVNHLYEKYNGITRG